LMGVIYILDEPSIGLHQRDNRRLIDTLIRLRDLGNTIIVVEHDEETIRSADHIIDIGPGAGEQGGWIVVSGPPEEIIRHKDSITGQYLRGEKKIPIPKVRRKPSGAFIEIRGARQHNLKNINVKFPLGTFICVTGVSGSGKSTLLQETLYPRLMYHLHGSHSNWGEHDEIIGIEHIDKVIDIDQSPIGRTPRSNPATYTGTFDLIRDLFASTPDARMRGYKPGRFSFNVKGGRCEACRGDGIIKIEMHFLPDVYVPCEVCKGKRYNRETLEVKYKGKNIADVLDMTVSTALEFFKNIPAITRRLQTIHDVGLDYIKLGQPATTLSGGEAQRVKLAAELSKRSTGRTLYILDEPTTGLHFADIQKLLDVLNRLTDAGNTVIVIEHNLDVIKSADYIIDLGPEGGEKGGRVIACGTPEEVARVESSYTGQFLKRVLSVS
ncbi:MAG: excinuclease ABC subunit UvrA, partial [Armatimonadota bacterium]|nr:excinuclease ABC subunit UvrA [Armatimonadota bacterium]